MTASRSGGQTLQPGRSAHDPHATRQGFLFGILAYGWWGLIPLYFKTVAHVPPIEILGHRVVWSCALLAIVVTATKRWRVFVRALGNRKVLGILATTTALIATNWFIYIYAISVDKVLQASLGYFITPLANVALGVAFLREHVSRLQYVAIAIAAVGVVTLALLGGEIPWIALGLAVSFSFYGLLRKTVDIDGLLGLFIETLILLPWAAGLLGWIECEGAGAFRLADPGTAALLMLGGVVTAVPLLAFAAAARRLKLSTLGFLQYLAPSVQFLLAVLAFREPFSGWQIASFGCIWGAIVLYSLDSFRATRAARAPHAEDETLPAIEEPVADAIDGLESCER